jgi:hypothetical protein
MNSTYPSWYDTAWRSKGRPSDRSLLAKGAIANQLSPAGRVLSCGALLVLVGACAHSPLIMDFEPSGRWEGIGVIKWPQAPGDSMVTRLAMHLTRTNGKILGTAETEALAPIRSSKLRLSVIGAYSARNLTLRFEVLDAGLRGFTLRGRVVANDTLRGFLDGSGYQHTQIVLVRIGNQAIVSQTWGDSLPPTVPQVIREHEPVPRTYRRPERERMGRVAGKGKE